MAKVEKEILPLQFAPSKTSLRATTDTFVNLPKRTRKPKNQFILFVAVAANLIGRMKRWMPLRTFFVIWNHFGKRWRKGRNFAKSQSVTLIDFSNGRENGKDWSPSWTNRVITQIRMIWHFGRDKGLTLNRHRHDRRKTLLNERDGT